MTQEAQINAGMHEAVANAKNQAMSALAHCYAVAVARGLRIEDIDQMASKPSGWALKMITSLPATTSLHDISIFAFSCGCYLEFSVIPKDEPSVVAGSQYGESNQ